MFPAHLIDCPIKGRGGGAILTAIYVPFDIGLASVRLYDVNGSNPTLYHCPWFPKTAPDTIDVRTILSDALDMESILERCNLLLPEESPPSIPEDFFNDNCLAIQHSFEDLITIEGEVYKRVQFENRPIIAGAYFGGVATSKLKWSFYGNTKSMSMRVHTVLPEENFCFYAETFYFENMHQEFPPEVNAQFPTLATCMKEWASRPFVRGVS